MNFNIDVLERGVLFMLDDRWQCYFVYWLNHETIRECLFTPKIKHCGQGSHIKIYPPEDPMESIGYPHRSRKHE